MTPQEVLGDLRPGDKIVKFKIGPLILEDKHFDANGNLMGFALIRIGMVSTSPTGTESTKMIGLESTPVENDNIVEGVDRTTCLNRAQRRAVFHNLPTDLSQTST